MPLNTHLKMVKMTYFMFCIVYHNLKKFPQMKAKYVSGKLKQRKLIASKPTL